VAAARFCALYLVNEAFITYLFGKV
jgi:hypothetical protein